MAHDVYICYDEQQLCVAQMICSALEKIEIKCWYAGRDLQSESSREAEIVSAIRESRIFILVFSEEANASDAVLSEMANASGSKCFTIPFRMTTETPNKGLSYYLTKLHWADATFPPIEGRVDELIEEVNDRLRCPFIDKDRTERDDLYSDSEEEDPETAKRLRQALQYYKDALMQSAEQVKEIDKWIESCDYIGKPFPEAALYVLNKYRSREIGKTYFANSDKFGKVLRAAVKSYARRAEGEIPLAVYSETIFTSSGKNGFVVTDRAIYIKHLYQDAAAVVPLNRIICFSDTGDNAVVEWMNEAGVVSLCDLSCYTSDADLVHMLNEFLELYRKYHSNEKVYKKDEAATGKRLCRVELSGQSYYDAAICVLNLYQGMLINKLYVPGVRFFKEAADYACRYYAAGAMDERIFVVCPEKVMGYKSRSGFLITEEALYHRASFIMNSNVNSMHSSDRIPLRRIICFEKSSGDLYVRYSDESGVEVRIMLSSDNTSDELLETLNDLLEVYRMHH